MKKRSGNSKRGVSLAYAMVAAMALLILSGALIAAAGRNASLTANSVEGRQAYLTTKSSIEYAKTVLNEEQKTAGLLVKDMEKDELDQSGTADDLQRIEAAMSGFPVYQTGDSAAFSQTGTSGSTRAAECVVTRKTVREIQYWTAIRSEGPKNGTYTLTPYVEKKVLENGTQVENNSNYQTGESVSSSAGASEEETTPKLSAVRVQVLFQIKVSASVLYGNGRFHRSLSYETLCTIGSGEESVTKPGQPVEISQPGPTVPDHPDPDFLATGMFADNAPYLNSGNFMGGGVCNYPVVLKTGINVGGSGQSLKAPSIYLMNGMTYQAGDAGVSFTTSFLSFSGNVTSQKDNRSHLMLYALSGGTVLVNFNQATLTRNDGSKMTENGYYSVPSGTDLFSSAAKLTPVTDSSVYQSYSSRITYLQQNLNNILSADNRNGDNMNWIQSGNISDGTPSDLNQVSGRQNAIVYLNVTNCGSWSNTFQNHRGSDGYSTLLYGAKALIMEWKTDLAVPAKQNNSGNTLVFRSDYVSMDLGGNTIRAGDQNAHLKIVSVNGKDPVLLQLANDVTVSSPNIKASDNSNSYTLDKGIYQVPSGTDLFTNEAKSDIKNIGGSSSGGGSDSGSGSSVTVTIPSYTVEPTGPNSFTGGKYVDG